MKESAVTQMSLVQQLAHTLIKADTHMRHMLLPWLSTGSAVVRDVCCTSEHNRAASASLSRGVLCVDLMPSL